jgi:hypothetical protein
MHKPFGDVDASLSCAQIESNVVRRTVILMGGFKQILKIHHKIMV